MTAPMRYTDRAGRLAELLRVAMHLGLEALARRERRSRGEDDE